MSLKYGNFRFDWAFVIEKTLYSVYAKALNVYIVFIQRY